MGKRKSREEVGDRINLFRMIRDVLLQSMSKGQLPVAGMILLARLSLFAREIGNLKNIFCDSGPLS